VPALIDEYHWVTMTNKVKPPGKDTLKRFIKTIGIIDGLF